MALIKCEECGKEVSDKAETCPHCGAPVESGEKGIEEDKSKKQNGKGEQTSKSTDADQAKKVGCGKKVLYGIFILIVFGIIMSIISPDPTPKTPQEKRKIAEQKKQREKKRLEKKKIKIAETAALGMLEKTAWYKDGQLSHSKEKEVLEHQRVDGSEGKEGADWYLMKILGERTEKATFMREMTQQMFLLIIYITDSDLNKSGYNWHYKKPLSTCIHKASNPPTQKEITLMKALNSWPDKE